MPNGWDRNWYRFASTVEGFKARYGHWPSLVVAVRPMRVDSVRLLFLPETFDRLTAKIRLVERDDFDGDFSWDGYFYAQDDAGSRITYGDASGIAAGHQLELESWLAIKGPDAPHESH